MQDTRVPAPLWMLQRFPPGCSIRSVIGRNRDALRDLQVEGGAHEPTRVGLLRVFEDLIRGAQLHHLPVAHDKDVMAHCPYHAQVVTDEEDTQTVSLLEIAQKF